MKTEERIIMGVDIGGTGIKYALVNSVTGEMLTERFKKATPKPATPQAVASVIQEAKEHLDWNGDIGCGLPSIVSNGVALSAANIDNQWIDLNVNEFLSKFLNCNVKVVNDADAAGLAEIKFGAGKNINGVVLLLTIGTGIGSALFVNGNLVPNTELGHIKFKKDTAEKYASNTTKKQKNLSYKEWANRMNKLLAHLERLFTPSLFILGGGISKRYYEYSDYLQCNADIVPAEQDNAAGVIGAAMAFYA